MTVKTNVAAKQVTIKDIAAHLGIAFSTVSRALHDKGYVSPELKARVRATAEELGYIPNASARLLHEAHTSTVGLIVPDFQNQLFASIAQVLAVRCAREGYGLMLGMSNDDPEMELKEVAALREARVAAIAIAACGRSLRRTVELLRMGPVLQLAARGPELNFPSVAMNDENSLRLATRHLLQLGHRRVAFIGGPGSLGTAQRRLAGFRAAFESEGLAPDPAHIMQGPISVDFGRMATMRLLQSGAPPTAIVMANSSQTEGAIAALASAGLSLPEDLSFVGHGDLSWFRLWGKGITTIDTKADEFAAVAATMLMEQIAPRSTETADRGGPLHYVLESSLIQRGSTGPLSH